MVFPTQLHWRYHSLPFNTLRPRQNGCNFTDIFKCIFLHENVWIPIWISLKFIPKGPINNIPALVQIMAWRQPGDKPLFEPMMVRLPTHICVTRPQWVKAMVWHIKIGKQLIPEVEYLFHIISVAANERTPGFFSHHSNSQTFFTIKEPKYPNQYWQRILY